jgi:hypothetical protein
LAVLPCLGDAAWIGAPPLFEEAHLQIVLGMDEV